MSRLVVSESHLTADEKCEVPDMEDFAHLRSKISFVETLMSERTDLLSNEAKKLQEEIKKSAQRLEELAKELKTPQWKEKFKTDLATAFDQFSQKYDQIHRGLDQRMEKLPRLDALDKHIEAVFVHNADTLKKGLKEFGRDFHEQISGEKEQALQALAHEQRHLLEELSEQAAAQLKIFAVLKEAATHIAWDTAKA